MNKVVFLSIVGIAALWVIRKSTKQNIQTGNILTNIVGAINHIGNPPPDPIKQCIWYAGQECYWDNNGEQWLGHYDCNGVCV
jgi:hypothetical protein